MQPHRKFQISVAICFIAIIVGLFIYGNVKNDQLKNNVYKNKDIGGMYGLNLGDFEDKIFKTKDLTRIYNRSFNDYKYDYYEALIKNTEYDEITIYTTKYTGKIYKMKYVSYIKNPCDVADAAMVSLREEYGLGDYNWFNALINDRIIDKKNRYIRISCRENTFFTSHQSLSITYIDNELEKTVDDEYKKYIQKKADMDLKLN